jgi:8-oxo-dGTP pyrophosphatase MutT (NUDIX family)
MYKINYGGAIVIEPNPYQTKNLIDQYKLKNYDIVDDFLDNNMITNYNIDNKKTTNYNPDELLKTADNTKVTEANFIIRTHLTNLFEKKPDKKIKLLATDNKQLLCLFSNPILGIGTDNKGQNLFGRILMELRDEFKQGSKKEWYVLMVKSKFSRMGRGTLEFPGGNIDNGDNPKQTAKKEVNEESGLSIHDINESYIHVLNPKPPLGRYNSILIINSALKEKPDSNILPQKYLDETDPWESWPFVIKQNSIKAGQNAGWVNLKYLFDNKNKDDLFTVRSVHGHVTKVWNYIFNNKRVEQTNYISTLNHSAIAICKEIINMSQSTKAQNKIITIESILNDAKYNETYLKYIITNYIKNTLTPLNVSYDKVNAISTFTFETIPYAFAFARYHKTNNNDYSVSLGLGKIKYKFGDKISDKYYDEMKLII